MSSHVEEAMRSLATIIDVQQQLEKHH